MANESIGMIFGFIFIGGIGLTIALLLILKSFGKTSAQLYWEKHLSERDEDWLNQYPPKPIPRFPEDPNNEWLQMVAKEERDLWSAHQEIERHYDI